MLVLWTGAKLDTITKTVLGALAHVDGDIQYKIEVPSKDQIVYPQEGQVVLAMGGDLVKALQVKGYIPKNSSLAKMRGQCIPYKTGGCWMVSYSPNLVFMDDAKGYDIGWDAKLAYRVLTTGSVAPKLGAYRWVSNFKDIITRIEEKFDETGKAVEVALDLETQGLYPYYPDKNIVTVSLTVDENSADVAHTYQLPKDKLDIVLKDLKWVMTTDKVSMRGANLKFDLVWIIEKWGIECKNFNFDTLIVGSLVDENRSNSLNLHAKIYSDMGGYDDLFNKKYDKSKMEKVPKDDLLIYAGGDTDATLKVSKELKRQLITNRGLTQLYVRILHPAVRAFEKIEHRGMHVDIKRYHSLKQDLEKEIGRLEQEAFALIPRRLKLRLGGGLKLTPNLIKQYMFTPYGLNLTPIMRTKKTQEPSTANEHLMMFADNPDAAKFVACLEEMGSAKKTLSTYVDGFLEHLRPDNKFHPTYMLFNGSIYGDTASGGTVTGRCVAAGEQVKTDNGLVPIECIKIGDRVKTHTGTYKPVEETYDNGVKECVRVQLQHEKYNIRCTPDHPVLTRRGWVKAADLTKDDEVWCDEDFNREPI